MAAALLAALIASAPPTTRFELLAYEPRADPAAIVVVGSARFTVLTSRLIRMEYASSKNQFEDRPTLAFVNRKQPVPKFSWDGTTLKTEALTLTYKGGPFTSTSLSVQRAAGASSAFDQWTFGQTSASDPGNLRGTVRTLDRIANLTLNCTANQNIAHAEHHCAWGVVSRSGWALVNETGVPCLDDNDWWASSSGQMLRNVDEHDLYLFAHGHDYAGALADLTAVGGKIPVLPRRNSGVWFTRWYDYDAQDVATIVDEFQERSLPLDVLVLDMNWHTKDDWTGYTFDKSLFPEPEDTLGYLHERGLSVAANLHDADGINPWEATHSEVARALGLPPNVGRIPLSLTNQSYMYALEDITVKAVEDLGMDFWWLDWQQGETQANTGQDGRPDGKMNPTIWTAKARVTDSLRRCRLGLGCSSKRGVVFARWGGLGQHRYQHGFSGDVQGLTWANLAYQAYFSATATNVGFGFWSHDIVGNPNDHEMYARWLQLAGYSAVLRMHDRGGSAGGCMPWPTSDSACWTSRPWNVPRAFSEANAAALRTRARRDARWASNHE